MQHAKRCTKPRNDSARSAGCKGALDLRNSPTVFSAPCMHCHVLLSFCDLDARHHDLWGAVFHELPAVGAATSGVFVGGVNGG